MALSAHKSRGLRVAAAVAAALALVLGTSPAGRAAPGRPAAAGALTVSAGNSPGALARLEARAAALARHYRGQLALLDDAQSAASVSMARALRLRRQLAGAKRGLAALAAVSYMSGVQDPAAAIMGTGDPQRILQASATAEYIARQRSMKEHSLQRFIAAQQRAEQAAQARMAQLRRMIAALAAQRRQVDVLLARFHPQSPVIGPNITPRMLQVKNAVDRRFGPFTAIGCYRPEASGEHPLGRACDFMLSTGGVMPTAANVQRGYAIAAWAQANASRLGIMYIIYRQKIWDIRIASAGWVPMADRGSITANHYDHVHISVF